MKTQTMQPQVTATKQLAASLAVLCFAVLGTATANAQLINGNLDQTYQQEIVPGFFLPKPAGWINTGFRTTTGAYEDEMSSEPWAGPAPTPATLNDMGVFFKPFTGNLGTGDLATGHLYQDVAGIAGATYHFTGWAGAEANYSGLIPGSATKSQFSLEFLGAANNVLGSTILDLRAAGLGSPNGQAFNYQQFSLLGVAPMGTVTVRAGVSMIDAFGNPAGGGQAFVVDDFDLVVVPEPTTLALAGVGFVALLAVRRKK